MDFQVNSEWYYQHWFKIVSFQKYFMSAKWCILYKGRINDESDKWWGQLFVRQMTHFKLRLDKLLSFGVLICLDCVSIETLNLNTVKKLESYQITIKRYGITLIPSISYQNNRIVKSNFVIYSNVFRNCFSHRWILLRP